MATKHSKKIWNYLAYGSFRNNNFDFIKKFNSFINQLKVIKFDESKVEFYQTKVEIKLKKADPVSWARLEYTKKN